MRLKALAQPRIDFSSFLGLYWTLVRTETPLFLQMHIAYLGRQWSRNLCLLEERLITSSTTLQIV
jgi:hypothetical protein